MSLARLTQISSLFVPIETSQEVEGSHTLTGKKAQRGRSMSPLIDPFEGGGAETIETSGGEDAALATITTTQYDLSVTLQDFERTVLPHLHAAYNVARWLTRNDQDAEDVVQEAYLRAWKFFGSFRGGESRPWLLTIVRRTCYSWLQHNRAQEPVTAFDDEHHSVANEEANPETLLLHRVQAQELRQALEALPLAFREVIILRELEDCSYKEIAAIADVPLGTVMSRLARARQRLQHWLVSQTQGGLP